MNDRNKGHGADLVRQLQIEVQRQQPRYLTDLERLVNTDCGSYTRDGVNEIADWMAARLAELGADIGRHSDETLGDTLVASFETTRAGPSVLMIGHMDTVFEEGTVATRPLRRARGTSVRPGGR